MLVIPILGRRDNSLASQLSLISYQFTQPNEKCSQERKETQGAQHKSLIPGVHAHPYKHTPTPSPTHMKEIRAFAKKAISVGSSFPLFRFQLGCQLMAPAQLKIK